MELVFMKRIAVSLLYLTIAVSLVQAQGKTPAWVKKEPQRKDSYIGIAKAAKPNPMDTIPYNPFYKEETQRAALWKIASQMPWNVDVESSLYAKLMGKELYKTSLNEVLLGEILKSPLFVMEAEWENETEYWCYYSIKQNVANEFIVQLVDSTLAKGVRMYNEARLLQEEGYLYKAAQKYIETLDSLHPAIFRYLPVSSDTGFVDLGQLVYESYLNVYKGIEITTDVRSIPAVYNEEVPGKYAVVVMQDGIPLKNLGVFTEFNGVISATPNTDENGMCYFSIDSVSSQAEQQSIGFRIDTEYLMRLPSIYGCDSLHGSHLFPSLQIPLYLFSPKVYTKINTAITDSLLKVNLYNVWRNNRNDVVLTECSDSADVIVDIDVDIVKKSDFNTGKYQFAQYQSTLAIKVKGVADDVVLTEYMIEDFDIMLPASRNTNQVRNAALREMIRRMNRELPEEIKEYRFDKRELVWRQLVSISRED